MTKRSISPIMIKTVIWPFFSFTLVHLFSTKKRPAEPSSALPFSYINPSDYCYPNHLFLYMGILASGYINVTIQHIYSVLERITALG